MQASTTNLTAIYVYSNNNNVKTLLQKLKTKSGLPYCKMLRQMIWDLSASDRLRRRVKSHFEKWGANWNPAGSPNHIRIRQDHETISLASVLSFQICGSGNLSEFARLLFRFYHENPDEVDLLKVSAQRSIDKGQEPRPEKAQTKALALHQAIRSEASKRFKEEKAAAST